MSQNQALRYVIAAANAGNAALAKTHLQKAAEAAPDDAGVWLWMGWFADSPLSSVHCLQMALQDERYRDLAEAGLAWCRAMANFSPDAIPVLPLLVKSDVIARAAASVVSKQTDEELVDEIAAVTDEVATSISATSRVETPVEIVEPVAVHSEQSVAVESHSEVAPAPQPAALNCNWGASRQIIQPSVNNAPIQVPPRKVAAPTRDWFGWESSDVTDSDESEVVAPTPSEGHSATTAWLTPDATPEIKVTETTLPEQAVLAEVSSVTSLAEESDGEINTTVTSASESDASPGIWRAAKDDWFAQNTESCDEDTSEVTNSVEQLPSFFSPKPEVIEPLQFEDAEPDVEFVAEAPVDERVTLDHDPQLESDIESLVVSDPVIEVEFDDASSESELEPEPEPVAETRAAEPVHSATNSRKDGKNGKTILVVDDSPTVRKLVAMTLEKRGFMVVSAFDGVAAIKEIATHSPDLILMDVNMPRLDGYQLCKLVKKHETTRHIPVVMLSGKDGMFDRLRGRLVGCSGYITKPFVPEDLVESVEEHLSQAASV